MAYHDIIVTYRNAYACDTSKIQINLLISKTKRFENSKHCSLNVHGFTNKRLELKAENARDKKKLLITRA